MNGLAAAAGLVATLNDVGCGLTQNNLPLALATMPLAGCLLGFFRYKFGGARFFWAPAEPVNRYYAGLLRGSQE